MAAANRRCSWLLDARLRFSRYVAADTGRIRLSLRDCSRAGIFVISRMTLLAWITRALGCAARFVAVRFLDSICAMVALIPYLSAPKGRYRRSAALSNRFSHEMNFSTPHEFAALLISSISLDFDTGIR